MLDVRQVDNIELIQLKNPWSHKRWKGNFSADDRQNWTADLKRALNYDQLKAMQVDNGVFWIDLKSFTKFFDVVYLNWNPEMFKYSTTQHGTWTPENAGPIKVIERNLANSATSDSNNVSINRSKSGLAQPTPGCDFGIGQIHQCSQCLY